MIPITQQNKKNSGRQNTAIGRNNGGLKKRVHVSTERRSDEVSKQSGSVGSVQKAAHGRSSPKKGSKKPENRKAAGSQVKAARQHASGNHASWVITPIEQEPNQKKKKARVPKQQPTGYSQKTASGSHGKKRRVPVSKWLALCIAAVVILVIVIEGIAACNRSESNQNTEQQQTSSNTSTVTSPVTESTAYPAGTDPETLGSMTQLVNKKHGLPADYVPSDLVEITNAGIRTTYLRSEAAQALSELFAAAENEGAILLCCSGFRDYTSQQEVYAREVSSVGETEAANTTAPAGFSEHQTGLAMDVTSISVNMSLGTNFINTTEGQWLDQNAWKYGFIIRYPNGQENITGYTYEPWHIRYLGKEVAKAVYESGKTYEEYLGILD